MKDEHPDNIDHRAIHEVNKELVNKPKPNIEADEEDDESFTINKENISQGEEVTDDEGEQIVEEKGKQIELDVNNQDDQEVGDIVNNMERLAVASDDSIEKNPTRLSGIVPKTQSRIMYQLPGELALREVIVLGRAEKATGKSKYWYNVKKTTHWVV